jgi:Uncharacterized protein conserved in bacteria
MEKYLAMLRGINVSGQKLIKMEVLKKQAKEIGLKNVSTYIQSGNILFETETTDKLRISENISAMIQKEYGFQVPVVVKSREDLKFTLLSNPFLAEHPEEIDFLYVTFLSDSANPDLVTKIDTNGLHPEAFAVTRDLVYVYCPKGYGRTKLNNNFFENKLKLLGTTRNWKTVLKLSELLS